MQRVRRRDATERSEAEQGESARGGEERAMRGRAACGVCWTFFLFSLVRKDDLVYALHSETHSFGIVQSFRSQRSTSCKRGRRHVQALDRGSQPSPSTCGNVAGTRSGDRHE